MNRRLSSLRERILTGAPPSSALLIAALLDQPRSSFSVLINLLASRPQGDPGPTAPMRPSEGSVHTGDGDGGPPQDTMERRKLERAPGGSRGRVTARMVSMARTASVTARSERRARSASRLLLGDSHHPERRLGGRAPQ
ncbi:unnamed protein product [Gadus morhua 'NCC']